LNEINKFSEVFVFLQSRNLLLQGVLDCIFNKDAKAIDKWYEAMELSDNLKLSYDYALLKYRLAKKQKTDYKDYFFEMELFDELGVENPEMFIEQNIAYKIKETKLVKM